MLIYTSPDGKTRIDVRVEGETVWLTQAEMAELFQSTKQNISLHVKNIFQEIELPEHSVVKEYLTTAKDGKKYLTKFYNLDVIISVGYMAEASSEIQQVLRQSVVDPISWTKKYPFLRWWAALRMMKESQCLKYVRVTHPA